MDSLQATAEVHATLTDLLTMIDAPHWLTRMAFTDDFLDDVILAYRTQH